MEVDEAALARLLRGAPILVSSCLLGTEAEALALREAVHHGLLRYDAVSRYLVRTDAGDLALQGLEVAGW